MSPEERAFWEDFLYQIKVAIDEEDGRESVRPYSLSPALLVKFGTAVTVYDGDQYCQIAQIRNLFFCPPAVAN